MADIGKGLGQLCASLRCRARLRIAARCGFRRMPAAVHQHQTGGLRLGKPGLGLGDIEHKVALASRTQGACQQSAPARTAGAAQVGIASQWRAIDPIAVLAIVAWAGQSTQTGDHAPGHIGDLFFAAAGREAVQHAVIATDIEHRQTVLVAQHKVEVACVGMARRRLAQVPDLRMHDIALARMPVAQAAAVLGLMPALAPQVVQPLLAAGLALLAIGVTLQGQLVRRTQVAVIRSPAKSHAALLHIAPSQHQTLLPGNRIELVSRCLPAPAGCRLQAAIAGHRLGLYGASPGTARVVAGGEQQGILCNGLAGAGSACAGSRCALRAARVLGLYLCEDSAQRCCHVGRLGCCIKAPSPIEGCMPQIQRAHALALRMHIGPDGLPFGQRCKAAVIAQWHVLRRCQDVGRAGPGAGLPSNANRIGLQMGPAGGVVAGVPVAFQLGRRAKTIGKTLAARRIAVIGFRQQAAAQACALQRVGPAVKSPVRQGAGHRIAVKPGGGPLRGTATAIDLAIGQDFCAAVVVLRAAGGRAVPAAAGQHNVVVAAAAEVATAGSSASARLAGPGALRAQRPAQVRIGLAEQVVQIAAVAGTERAGKGQSMLAMPALQRLHAVAGQTRAVDRAGARPAALALHHARRPAAGRCAMVPHRLPGQAYRAIGQLLVIAQYVLERMAQHGDALRARVPDAFAIGGGDAGQTGLGAAHAALHRGRVIDGDNDIRCHDGAGATGRLGGQLQ